MVQEEIITVNEDGPPPAKKDQTIDMTPKVVTIPRWQKIAWKMTFFFALFPIGDLLSDVVSLGYFIALGYPYWSTFCALILYGNLRFTAIFAAVHPKPSLQAILIMYMPFALFYGWSKISTTNSPELKALMDAENDDEQDTEKKIPELKRGLSERDQRRRGTRASADSVGTAKSVYEVEQRRLFAEQVSQTARIIYRVIKYLHSKFKKQNFIGKFFIAFAAEFVLIFAGLTLGTYLTLTASVKIAHERVQGIDREEAAYITNLYNKVIIFVEAIFESLPQLFLQTSVFIDERYDWWIYATSMFFSFTGVLHAIYTFRRYRREIIDVLGPPLFGNYTFQEEYQLPDKTYPGGVLFYKEKPYAREKILWTGFYCNIELLDLETRESKRLFDRGPRNGIMDGGDNSMEISRAPNGDFYIAGAPDQFYNLSNKIYIFDKDFKVKGELPHPDDSPLLGPDGVTTHMRKVYVSDYGNNRIVVYNRKTGRQEAVWTGAESGESFKPCGMSLLNNLSGIAVADILNNRIIVFSIKGNDAGKIKMTFGKGELRRPTDVVQDPDGNFVVCDAMNKRLVVFEPDGDLISAAFSERFTIENPYNFIAVSKDTGRLAVSDNDGHRIYIFRYMY